MQTVTGVTAEYVADVESSLRLLTQHGGGVPSIEAAGDSWAAGFGTTATKYDYVERLAKVLGKATVTNAGVAGGTATGTFAQTGVTSILRNTACIPDLTAGPYFSKGGLKIDQCCYNDQTVFGATTTAVNNVVENCLTARYSALKAARHMNYNDSAITSSSGVTVAPDTTLCMGNGYLYMSANGQYIDIALDSFYNGEPICFMIPMFPSLFTMTGIMTFRLNPTGANTLLGTFDGATFDATLRVPATKRDSTMCFRIGRGILSPGAQTIRVTASGMTGSNFCTITGAVIEGKAPLLLPLYRARDISLNTNIAWANARIKAVAQKFDNTLVVDPTADLADTVNLYFDIAHPNNLGHARMTKALLRALPSVLSSENVGEMN